MRALVNVIRLIPINDFSAIPLLKLLGRSMIAYKDNLENILQYYGVYSEEDNP